MALKEGNLKSEFILIYGSLREKTVDFFEKQKSCTSSKQNPWGEDGKLKSFKNVGAYYLSFPQSQGTGSIRPILVFKEWFRRTWWLL